MPEIKKKKLSKRVERQIMDALRIGTGITKTGARKKYNPLRYIFGRTYCKTVSLKDVFK